MIANTSHTETQCRSCKSDNIGVFLDLGETPLSDRLVDPAHRSDTEPVFPLKVAFCSDCSLVQITETVDPNILFADKYPYYSSFLPALLAHSRKNVLARIEDRKLGKNSLVIELASNDGYLLKNYVEAEIPVLGIDPADGPPAVAEEIGVPTINDFFTKELADKLASKGKVADVIHGNNVLAHVADTNGFVAGIKTILKPDGVAVIEAPYLKPLIDHVEFDTIYHEHLCYFSVTALDHLFKRHGLYLNHVEHLSIHGGSLRLFVEQVEAPEESVLALLKDERDIGMDTPAYFQDFAERVNALKASLVNMVRDLKEEKYSVAAYGAAAKGATMLNFCGLNYEDIDFVVDRNTHKQGQLMPGAHLPILAPEALVEKNPDYVVILAWNFTDEILEQQADYRKIGGKFIIPVPSPCVI